jgi:hypothetical protein
VSAANRNRGARAEVAVVNYLRQNGWPDARRYLAGDGRQPGDVDFHPLVCLEVKDVKASAWPSWCRQAAAEARPGMVPVVVRRERGVPDVGQWECRVERSGWNDITDPGRPMSWAEYQERQFPEWTIERVTYSDPTHAYYWGVTTFASFVAALARFDALDGAR